MDVLEPRVVINKDSSRRVSTLGEPTSYLRDEPRVRRNHLVDGDDLSWRRSNENLSLLCIAGRLGAPREPGHRTKEAGGTLGRGHVGQVARYLAELGEIMKLGEGHVT